MRRLQKNAPSSPIRDSPREPMAEGAIPLGKNGQRKWYSMSDAQLIQHTRDFMKEKGITWRVQLRKADPGLYAILLRRKLIAKAGFEQKQGERCDWSSMTDDQLIQYAQDFMKEKGIALRSQLETADSRLYNALRKRKLLAEVGFERKRRECRDWSSLTDAQLIQHARDFMKENGIIGKRELENADQGLYEALRKRELLAEVGFEQKRRDGRDWFSMTEVRLVQHARSFMKENGITRRIQLRKADRGLYDALYKRNLLSAAFAGIEQSKRQILESELVSSLRQAADAMADFGGEKE